MGVDRCDVVGVAGRLNVGRRRWQSVVAAVGQVWQSAGSECTGTTEPQAFQDGPARKWGQWARAWAEITTRHAARH